jgi:hypothetical protein
MSVVANVACTTVAESKAPTHTITLLLPGLKKIIRFDYTPGQNPSGGYEEINKKYIVPSAQFKQAVCNVVGVLPRRAEIYLQKLYSLDSPPEFDKVFGMHKDINIYPGDTILLLVRGTKVEGENNYYNIQQETLLKNTFIGANINRLNAIQLLCDIQKNFELEGYKNAIMRFREMKEMISGYPSEEEEKAVYDAKNTKPTGTSKHVEIVNPTPFPTHQCSGPRKCWTCWWKGTK